MARARQRLAEISVLELPWAENPFRCGLRDIFLARTPAFVALDDGDRQAAFARFVESRTTAELSRCPYHGPEVARANALAIRSLRTRSPIEELVEGEPDEVRDLATSYFNRPITWNRSQTQLTDGPHRACGLRMSAAGSCVVLLVE